MSTPALSLHPVAEPAADLDYVERLLADEGLPTDDVRSGRAAFFVATRDGERVGVGGLEDRGTAGLLRSVVVAPSARGSGVGTALVDALEAEAREAGVGALYLLTTTAAGFFADRGYERVPREDVPDPIRGTTQFSTLCPDSATVLCKRL